MSFDFFSSKKYSEIEKILRNLYNFTVSILNLYFPEVQIASILECS